MKTHHARSLALATVLALGACTSAPKASDAPVPSSVGPSVPGPTPTAQDVMDLGEFAPLKPGTYFIDPDADPSTPFRVLYEVPAEGWSQWIGTAKFTDHGHFAVTITTVTNLVRHGCRDHSPADPLVGPSVNALATALADLAPFRVTSPPEDVTIYGYSGKHLELTVPDLPVEGSGDDRGYPGCVGEELQSWIAPLLGGAFRGYNGGPGHAEEFWILDVDGIRLVIEANWSPVSPRGDMVEMRAILNSIRIEP
ncbi:MAG TPA: hypothetical protein VKA30_03220 [Actinomycetota bacterium]|nr:hypothetical protein [Actinomycetota bacterium]